MIETRRAMRISCLANTRRVAAWTSEEDEILRRNSHLPLKELRMFFPNRTKSSVVGRMITIGLRKSVRSDDLSFRNMKIFARFFSILGMLSTARGIFAEDFAEEFDMPVREVERYLETICSAGIGLMWADDGSIRLSEIGRRKIAGWLSGE